MKGRLHTIAGMACHIEGNSPEMMARLVGIIEGQADCAELIDRIEIGTVWTSDPWIEYVLKNDVRLSIGSGHAPGQVAGLLIAHRDTILTHGGACREDPEIDAVDAMLAIRYAGAATLRRMAAPQAGQLKISVLPGDYAPSIRRPVAEVKFKDGRLLRTGRRVTTTVWTQEGGRQSWDNRSLLVPMKDVLPQAVVIAMAGRPLDEIVAGTMLAGCGLTIRKAWAVGGRLGFSFAPRIISLHEALGLQPHTLPTAA